MAEPHEIEINIDDMTGEITLIVNGVKGQSCHDIAKIFNDALGSVQEISRTNEYYERPDKTKIKTQLKT